MAVAAVLIMASCGVQRNESAMPNARQMCADESIRYAATVADPDNDDKLMAWIMQMMAVMSALEAVGGDVVSNNNPVLMSEVLSASSSSAGGDYSEASNKLHNVVIKMCAKLD